jgi:uncharacterized protein
MLWYVRRVQEFLDVRALISKDGALSRVLEEASARLTGDPGHDVAHCLRVAEWTLRLGGTAIDPRHAIAAALLHDVINIPKDSPDRSRASERSAEFARPLLAEVAFDAIDLICEAIHDHSYSTGRVPRSPLGDALQDADRLEALGALGIFRTASCGARMGADYFDGDDPWAERRDLDDKKHTVDHFFRKLLLLPSTLRTKAGREEAERRASFMRAFLRQLGDEIGSPPPPSRFT